MREKWRVGKQIEKWRVSKQELAAAVASRSVRAYPAMMGSDGIRQRGGCSCCVALGPRLPSNDGERWNQAARRGERRNRHVDERRWLARRGEERGRGRAGDEKRGREGRVSKEREVEGEQ